MPLEYGAAMLPAFTTVTKEVAAYIAAPGCTGFRTDGTSNLLVTLPPPPSAIQCPKRYYRVHTKTLPATAVNPDRAANVNRW